jgi:hypothetical protein
LNKVQNSLRTTEKREEGQVKNPKFPGLSLLYHSYLPVSRDLLNEENPFSAPIAGGFDSIGKEVHPWAEPHWS